MLAMVLEEEVNAFLRRDRYERGKEFRGYRNGYHPKREVTVGLGPVEVRVPRVAEVPAQVSANGFESRIVLKYQRASEATRRLFTRLNNAYFHIHEDKLDLDTNDIPSACDCQARSEPLDNPKRFPTPK